MTAFSAIPFLLLLLLTTLILSTTSHVLNRTSHYGQNQHPMFSIHQQNTHGANIPCSCVQGTRVRKEYRSLTTAEFTRFVNAFKSLKNTNDGNSIFEQCSAAHGDNTMTAHSIRRSNPQFLPWHREFLFQVECRLRQIDPSVTIPYWDWSIDSNAPGSSSLWNLIGGARRDQSIPNEPFKDWSSSVPRQHRVIRGFNSNVSGSGSEWRLEDARTIRRFQIDSSLRFQVFASTLEIWHNRPHAGIGGDMGRLDSSPNDPAFFLHHAFIDKIWNEWQKLPGKRREYNGVLDGRPVSLSDTVTPWRGTIGDMFARDECVTYEELARSDVPLSVRRDTVQKVQEAMHRESIHQAGSDGSGEEEDDPEPLPTNIPEGLAEKAKKSPVIQDALKEADEGEIEKLASAKPGRVEAVAKRIAKNQVMEKWARESGYPQQMIDLAKKVAAEEDPSVKYNEVEDGTPP